MSDERQTRKIAVLDMLFAKLTEYGITHSDKPEAIFDLREPPFQDHNGFAIYATPHNHPPEPEDALWQDAFSPQANLLGTHKVPSLQLATVHYCWSDRTNTIGAFLLTTESFGLSMIAHRTNTDRGDIRNRPVDITWAAQKIDWLWQQAFPHTDRPRIIVIQPRSGISGAELCKAHLAENKVNRLSLLLHTGTVEERLQATTALKLLGDPKAIEPLHTALRRETNDDVLMSAAETLSSLGAQRQTAHYLTRILSGAYAMTDWEDDPYERNRWKKVLLYLGSHTVEPLIEALKDRNWGMRDAAAELLGRIGDPRAIAPLERLLRSESAGAVRQTAEHALLLLYDAKQ